jgi:molybdopterin biosynthesis enzyme
MKEVLNELGEIVSVTPNLEGSARHCFGTIGEDNVPVIALPGDPIAAFLSSELFIRPMIRTMLGVENVFRTTIEAAVTSDIESPLGITSVILSTLERTGTGTTLITPLADQTEMCSLSDAQALLTIPAAQTGALSGEIVDAIVLERIS